MLTTVREILTNPDSYFEEHASDPRLLPPVVVVGAYIVLSTLAYLPLFLRFDTDLMNILTYTMFSVLLMNGAMAVIAWLLLALGCQLLSFLLGGSGSFRRTFPLIGWGFLPLIGGNVVVLVATVVTVQGTPPIPVETPEQMAVVADSLMTGRSIQIAIYTYTVLYLWCCYIWVFVLKHARDLSLRRAFVAVVIPVVLVSLFGLL